MIPRLSFRCTVLVLISILFIQAIVLNIYLNFVPFNGINDVIIATRQAFSKAQQHTDSSHLLNYTCDITDSQAKLALKRMKTVDCKQTCIDVFCKVSHAKPWPSFIPSKCNHFKESEVGHLLSCHWFDDHLLNVFSNKKNKLFNNTNKEDCLSSCLQYNFKYAARYLNYCICTNNLAVIQPNNTVSCDMTCSDSHCQNRLLVFSTGLNKMPFYFPNKIPETKDFTPKVVFLLLLNGRSLLQVHRLLRNIYSSHHYYYIHVDSRHEYLAKELQVLENRFSNIKFARKRFASIWGGSSLLSTILSCIKEVLEEWNDWDFITNLSETDFPLKPIGELERYLASNMGRNFVKSHGKNTYDFVQMQALNKVFIECEQRMWRIANRDLIKGLVHDGGSDWVILNRNFSHFLTYTDDTLVKSLKSYFQYSLLPAESFFHVVLRNSEFCSTIVNNNLRVTNWNRKKGCKCQHKNVVDWCGCSPNTFRNKDSSRLLATQSKPFFFARKFEHLVDSDIIDLVEQSLLLNGLPLLDESVYLENSFSAKHDNASSLSESKLEFYSNHAKSLKDLISHHCTLNGSKSNDPIDEYQLSEVNTYFKNSKFFGLLLKYEASHNSKTVVTYEVILKRYLNDTVLLSTNIKPKLRSIKICNRFDVKEEIFRDFDCVIDQFTNFEVFHEWGPFFGQYNSTFIFLDPSNRINAHFVVTLNNTSSDVDAIVQLFRPEFPHMPLQAGMWKLLIFNQMEIVSVSKFMVLPAKNKDCGTNCSIKVHSATPQPPLDPFEKDIVLSFVHHNDEFLNPRNHLLWYIDVVCFETQSAEYSLKCVHPQIMPCADAKWNSNNVKARYLL